VEEETTRDSLVSGPSREFSFGVLSQLSSYAARGSVAKTPYFPETISCLASVPGESWDSGRGLGSDARANLGTLPPCQEGSRGQDRGGATDSRIGLIIGDFTLMRSRGHEGRGAGKTDPPGGSHNS
jgi:hypothetical protein